MPDATQPRLDEAIDVADRLAEHAAEVPALISVARHVRWAAVRARSLDTVGLVRVVEAVLPCDRARPRLHQPRRVCDSPPRPGDRPPTAG